MKNIHVLRRISWSLQLLLTYLAFSNSTVLSSYHLLFLKLLVNGKMFFNIPYLHISLFIHLVISHICCLASLLVCPAVNITLHILQMRQVEVHIHSNSNAVAFAFLLHCDQCRFHFASTWSSLY